MLSHLSCRTSDFSLGVRFSEAIDFGGFKITVVFDVHPHMSHEYHVLSEGCPVLSLVILGSVVQLVIVGIGSNEDFARFYPKNNKQKQPHTFPLVST